MSKFINSFIALAITSASIASFAQTADQQRSSADSARPATADSTSRTALPAIRGGRAEAPRPVQTRPPITSRPAEIGAFEGFAEGVTGRRLTVFGRDLFNDVPSTFSPVSASQVNPDYIVGTGDELQVRGWGMVDIDLSATVDRSGAIYIPHVGSVKVSGIAYRDLQGYLKKAVSKFYTNFELTASIAQTRAVQIYVVGNAVRPGTYTLSAMSTLLNALFESGGPTSAGSMRNIQVKRSGKTITSFDLYDMLTRGDKSRDVSLQDGDVIYIPEVGPLVALTGNVKKPSIFELNGKTSVADLVTWAGGFDSAAETKRVIVEKSVANSYQTIADFNDQDPAKEAQLSSLQVNPADVYRVFAPGAVPVQAQIQHEYVRVSGEINQSGVFELHKNETLRDLVSRLGGPTENGYLFATMVTRDSLRASQQAKLNEVADRFERDLETGSAQRIAGTADKDNVAIITAELERQRALAQRMRSIKAEGRIVLELEDSKAQVKDLPSLALQDGDSVYIPRRPGTVDVMGAVFQQNAFIYRPTRTVADYVGLAGGATGTSDKSEMYVLRADGTARSHSSAGWFSGLGSAFVNPGDTIVIPEKIERQSWTQSLKEWTAIFYQFGLGAAGLKVLKD